MRRGGCAQSIRRSCLCTGDGWRKNYAPPGAKLLQLRPDAISPRPSGKEACRVEPALAILRRWRPRPDRAWLCDPAFSTSRVPANGASPRRSGYRNNHHDNYHYVKPAAAQNWMRISIFNPLVKVHPCAAPPPFAAARIFEILFRADDHPRLPAHRHRRLEPISNHRRSACRWLVSSLWRMIVSASPGRAAIRRGGHVQSHRNLSARAPKKFELSKESWLARDWPTIADPRTSGSDHEPAQTPSALSQLAPVRRSARVE